MIIATQDDLDKFRIESFSNPDIYPYLGLSKYIPEWIATKNDWEWVWLTNESKTYFAKLTFTRHSDLEIDICLYSLSPIAAGRGIKDVSNFIKRYKPICINSCVHGSNTKSIAINRRVLGNEWGIEPCGAWNSLLGRYEELYRFKMVCQQ